MIGWQSIETAPKDGTEIIAFGYWAGEINGPDTSKKVIAVIKWSGGHSDYPSFKWEVLNTDAHAAWFNPFHWMPKPSNPD